MEQMEITPRLADGHQIRASKRQRYEAKQARIQQEESREQERTAWIERNSRFCTRVTLEDLQRLRSTSAGKPHLDMLLRPYRDLKDAHGKGNKEPEERLFIAEGTETVRLLIQQSTSSNTFESHPHVKVKSILVKPASLFDLPVRLLADIEKVYDTGIGEATEGAFQCHDTPIAPSFHVLVGDEAALSEIAGFHISRGALGCGIVPRDRDEAWLTELLARRWKTKDQRSLRLLALDCVSDSANMGSIIRCCAAFGIDALILSNDCCDPWYRRSVRVSMGHIFQLPIVRVDNLAATMLNLHVSGILSFAAVIDPDADLILEQIERRSGTVPDAWCCVIGSEANGISLNVKQSCSHRLRIDMVEGVDSLSLTIAAGILLHGLKERETHVDTTKS